MTNIDTPNKQMHDQHRYPEYTNTRDNIDTPKTQMHDQHRYP